MVLAALDANDPQPRRDDARFQGDYKAFRKADKAWNERERGRRTRQKLVAKTAAAAVAAAVATDLPPEVGAQQPEVGEQQSQQPSEPAVHRKPRGPVPKADIGGQSLPCDWDASDGVWRDGNGDVHDVAAARREKQQAFFAEQAADEAELQEHRRAQRFVPSR